MRLGFRQGQAAQGFIRERSCNGKPGEGLSRRRSSTLPVNVWRTGCKGAAMEEQGPIRQMLHIMGSERRWSFTRLGGWHWRQRAGHFGGGMD